MPLRQKKEKDSASKNDALTLLRLQQQLLQLTAATAALEDVQKLVHETALYNFTSAQDRRTLMRIRIEAQANTVEETVKQRSFYISAKKQLEYQFSLPKYRPRKSQVSRSGQAHARAPPPRLDQVANLLIGENAMTTV